MIEDQSLTSYTVMLNRIGWEMKKNILQYYEKGFWTRSPRLYAKRNTKELKKNRKDFGEYQ